MGWGPMGPDGSAAIYDVQLLLTYQWAADLEKAIGIPFYAEHYTKKALQLKATIKQKYWDETRKLFADTKEKKGYSQHVNSLAILANIVDKADLAAVGNSLATDQTLTQCTIYLNTICIKLWLRLVWEIITWTGWVFGGRTSNWGLLPGQKIRV